jgi:glycosyltransferase involved in cell wall biosynthesis
MRIIIHHRTQGRGVEAVHLLGIARGFTSIGHKVEIASPQGVELTTSKKSSRSLILSYFSKYSPEIFFEIMEIFNNFSANKILEKKRKRFGCDVVYERFALLNNIGARKAKHWGAKLAVEVNYTTKSPLDIRKRTRIFDGLAKKMERMTFDQAILLLPVSSTLANELKEMGYPEDKILISPNAVHPEDFRPSLPDRILRQKLGLQDGITFGYVGGFAPWHSLDILIQSVAMLTGIDQYVNLLLIGDGPMMGHISKLREKYREKLNIVLPGRVDHSDLPPLLNLIDIMVMPDSNDYGSPMKVFEYMAMGKPVVAPEYPPLHDVINHGIDGLLFKPNNAEILSETLRNLLNNKNLMSKLGENARKRVVAEHNWQNRARLIIERLNLISSS